MRFRVSDAKVAWRVVEGEGVLLHAETSAYFGLNRTGTLVWEQLAIRPVSVEDLAAWMRDRIAGVPVDVASELDAFIADLRRLDLLDQVEDGDGAAPSTSTPVRGEPDPGGVIYEPPVVLPFGELEKLILSGE